jgi:hypothetical protein
MKFLNKTSFPEVLSPFLGGLDSNLGRKELLSQALARLIDHMRRLSEPEARELSIALMEIEKVPTKIKLELVIEVEDFNLRCATFAHDLLRTVDPNFSIDNKSKSKKRREKEKRKKNIQGAPSATVNPVLDLEVSSSITPDLGHFVDSVTSGDRPLEDLSSEGLSWITSSGLNVLPRDLSEPVRDAEAVKADAVKEESPLVSDSDAEALLHQAACDELIRVEIEASRVKKNSSKLVSKNGPSVAPSTECSTAPLDTGTRPRVVLTGAAARLYRTAMGKGSSRNLGNRALDEFLSQVGGDRIPANGGSAWKIRVPSVQPTGVGGYHVGTMHICHDGRAVFRLGTLRAFLGRLLRDSGLDQILDTDS